MTEFDFAAAKVTTAKIADVPTITRPRALAGPSPLLPAYAKTADKLNSSGEGSWLTLPMPGKLTTNDKGRKTYGETVTKAQTLLLKAAKEYNVANGTNFSVSFRHTDDENGTVTLYFQAIPRATRAPKSTDDK